MWHHQNGIQYGRGANKGINYNNQDNIKYYKLNLKPKIRFDQSTWIVNVACELKSMEIKVFMLNQVWVHLTTPQKKGWVRG